MTNSPGIPNLFSVEQSQNIWRGGQPSPEGWIWLKEHGVTDVVKLNTEGEGSDALATRMGMKVHPFPIPWWRQTILRPDQSTLVNAVACLTQNVFVHCLHGNDRTGLVIGCFRLSEGWTKGDAYAEMIAHGFHDELLQGLEGRWNTQRPEDWIPK